MIHWMHKSEGRCTPMVAGPLAFCLKTEAVGATFQAVLSWERGEYMGTR